MYSNELSTLYSHALVTWLYPHSIARGIPTPLLSPTLRATRNRLTQLYPVTVAVISTISFSVKDAEVPQISIVARQCSWSSRPCTERLQAVEDSRPAGLRLLYREIFVGQYSTGFLTESCSFQEWRMLIPL